MFTLIFVCLPLAGEYHVLMKSSLRYVLIVLQVMYMALVLYTPCLALSVGKSARLHKVRKQNIDFLVFLLR